MTEYKNGLSDEYEYTILVVDDVEANIDILVETLGDDYEIIVATDGPTALETVDELLPDLILLDIMMPGMDGYEVCRRLKADDKAKDIPVIFITAKSDVEDEAKGFECGAVDYITKPISPPIVKARVKTHLALRQARTTLEMQNRDLIEAARLREDVDKIMRHDLKGPLASILGFSQLMIMEGTLKAEHLKFTKFIESSGLKMLSMINLSMDLFKMERGTYQFQPAEVDLYALALRISAEVQSLARAKKLDIRVLKLSSEATCIAWAEELLCYSMMVNLLKNAVEASPHNEIVNLTLDSGLGPQFAIHNCGAVPYEIRDRFFDKYITAGKTGGTGLGTYSARLMAETMGGNISMTTSDEVGTTITVRLQPVLQKTSGLATVDVTPEPSYTDSDIAKRPPMRLLIVDDDRHNRELLAKYLDLPSFTLITAENGLKALELLKTDSFDLVLMDWEMPVMTGSEVMRGLRTWEQENNIRRTPAAALTGHDTDEFKRQCLDDGFDLHLVKPVSRKTLLKMISALVRGEDLAGAVAFDKDTLSDESGPEAPNGVRVRVDADFRELVDDFLGEKFEEIEEIRGALSEGDFDKIRNWGHKLSGTSRMYGLNRLGEFGSALEKSALEEDPKEPAGILDDLEDYLKQIEIVYEELD